jgi:DNA-binding beta-propeller fold protein YncE
MGVAVDGTDLYVADSQNHVIRKIVISSGAVTTFAGQFGLPGLLDGPSTAAKFNGPAGLAIDRDAGALYVGDQANDAIRKIVIASGDVTTLASGPPLNAPQGVATDGKSIYVAGHQSHVIHQVFVDGGVVTLAGSGSATFADGTGAAAAFNEPQGVTTDGTYVYVGDGVNNRIRKITIDGGVVTTLAGQATDTPFTNGPLAAATFSQRPCGLAIDSSSHQLYVADQLNNVIRQIDLSTGQVSTLAGKPRTLAGSGDAGPTVNGPGASATFFWPFGLALDGTRLFVGGYLDNQVRVIQR